MVRIGSKRSSLSQVALEPYSSVEWNGVFLLAGVIPLEMALQQTEAAALLGDAVASMATFLPAIGVLWVFYLTTGC
jgi:di/tricarboxylate transporter